MARSRRGENPRGKPVQRPGSRVTRPAGKGAGTPQQRPSDSRRHRGRDEEVYCGVRACAALFAHRPQAIVRVYVSVARRQTFAALLEWCVREHRGFQVVAEENLSRITKSIHHEGVAILARAIPRRSLDDVLRESGNAAPGPILYVDGVQNPHNLGSILRTAAHFGCLALAGRVGELPPLSAAAVRVAEGAAESVPVCILADPPADLGRLRRQGFRIAVSSSRRGESLHAADLRGRIVIVLGSEGEGVSPAIDALGDLRLRIPGTGAVQSLNVSVACGVLLGEAWRQRAARD